MDILEELQRSGAVLRGHFELSSGLHSDLYFEKFRLLEQPQVLRLLCEQMVEPFREAGIQLVVGPTLGGALVAFQTASLLGVQARYLERSAHERRELRRGASIAVGTRVLLVDDVLTTGQSLRECLPVLEPAELVGVTVLLSRATERFEWPAPFHCLAELPAPAWSAADCPLCREGMPLTKPGSRGNV